VSWVRSRPHRRRPLILSELRLRGARPAGPPPAAAAARNGRLPAGAVIELDRAIDSSGILMLGGARLALGMNFARQRVTLRLDGHLLHVIRDGVLAKTLPSPVDLTQRGRLRGARVATGSLPAPPAGPVCVERRVPEQGVVMVTRQKIRVGSAHAGKLITVVIEDTHLRVHNGEELSLHPRANSEPARRFRAYAARKPAT
jgi:hypothetical protein